MTKTNFISIFFEHFNSLLLMIRYCVEGEGDVVYAFDGMVEDGRDGKGPSQQ